MRFTALFAVAFLLLTNNAFAKTCERVDLYVGVPRSDSPVLASILEEQGASPLPLNEIKKYLNQATENCIDFFIIPKDILQASADEANIWIINITSVGPNAVSGAYLVAKVITDANGGLSLESGEWRTGFFGGFPEIFKYEAFSYAISQMSFLPRFEAQYKNDSLYIEANRVIGERVKTVSSFSILMTSISAAGYERSAFAENLWRRTLDNKEARKVLAAAQVLESLGKVFVDPRFISDFDDQSIFTEAEAAQMNQEVYHPIGGSFHDTLYSAMTRELGYVYNGSAWVLETKTNTRAQ